MLLRDVADDGGIRSLLYSGYQLTVLLPIDGEQWPIERRGITSPIASSLKQRQ